MQHRLPAALALLVLAVAAPAFADVPPPNTAQCSSLKEGDACKDDNSKDGACTKSTCSKLDYSHGTPPTSVDYACLVCTAGASTTTSSSSSSSSGGGGCSMSGGAGAPSALLALLALPLLRRRRERKSVTRCP